MRAPGSGLLAALAIAACGPRTAPPPSAARCAPALPASPRTAEVIAVSSSGDGSVTLVHASSLAVARSVGAAKVGRVEAPMQIAADPRRAAFWVANFGGGLGRIPIDDTPVGVAATGMPLSGLALSPDGCRVAVNGAHDLALRLVDASDLHLVASVLLGNAAHAPTHAPLTHGLASTHPLWLADSSAVLTEDNVHEELVLVSRDGKILARRAMRSAVHSLLLTRTGEVLALEEGTADRAIAPAIAVLAIPSLEIVREIEVLLPKGERAKLHHGVLSPDGQSVVVANMGSLRGETTGSTVSAFRWRTGERLWSAPSVPGAGHAAFVAPDRVVVVGHRAAELIFLDAATGARVDGWPVLGAGSLGHGVGVDGSGAVTILDAPLGRVLRFRAGEPAGESERLGAGDAESSLPE